MKVALNEIRKCKPRASNTLGGSYQPPYSAKSTCFGDISYDPDLPFTVLSYHQQSELCYVHPGDEVFRAGFTLPNGEIVEIEFRFIEGMLIGDGAPLFDWYEDCSYAMFTRNSSMSRLQKLKKTKSGKPRKTKWTSTHPDSPSQLIKGQFRIISGYTDEQIRKLDLVWRLIRNSWSLSKKDIISLIRDGTLVNVNVDVEDVENFFKIFKFDVSKFQGTAKQAAKSSPRLDLKCDIQMKEIAVAGDILEVCSEYYLDMITIYGRFTMIAALENKSAGELIEKLILNLQKLGTYGWSTKFLLFDAEGALVPHRRLIEQRTGCLVRIQHHGTKVGIIELNNRCIRERVGAKYVTMTVESNAMTMQWLVIGAGNILNCSLRKMYDEDEQVVPRIAILGESTIDANYHFAYSPTDVVELYDERVEPARTITVIPLTTATDSTTDYEFYDPYNHEHFTRHVEQARVVPVPSDIIEIMKEKAQLYPVLPDPALKIKGTIRDDSYPQRSDPSHRGVVNRGVRRRARAPARRIENHVEDPIENPIEDAAADGENAEDPASANDAVEVNDGPTVDSAADAQLVSYELRSRQARGKMFLTYNPEVSERINSRAALVAVREDGSEIRTNVDPGVAPVSNDFVMVGHTPAVMIDDVATLEENEVIFSQTGLYIDKGGFVDYETIKDGCVFTTNMQAHQAVIQYGKRATYSSLREEIDGLLKRRCFTGVLRSNLSATQEKKRIRMSIFLKEKLDSKGNFQKLKSRLVAGGRLQLRDLFAPNEISSPTVSINSVFMVMALAVTQKRHFITFDIAQAYLNADMPDEVYMTLDKLTTEILIQIDPSYKEFVEVNKKGNKEITVKLNKALYGCVQSARLWYNTLSTYLKNVDFEPNPVDPCVFNRYTEAGDQTTVCFHVDDGLATSTDLRDLKLFEEQLRAEYGDGLKITYGKSHEYLGMAVDINSTYCELTMKKYIEDLVNDNGGFEQRRHQSPASQNLFNVTDSKLLDEPKRESFHKTVARLLYLATRVRPDILLAVTFLCSRVSKATAADGVKLQRVIGYLAETPELGKRLGGDPEGNATLTSFSDASFAVHGDMKSHNGQFLTLGLGGILIKSNKEKLVTRSSTEAELVCLSDGVSLASHCAEFLKYQGVNITPELMQDNMSTIKLAEKGRSTSDRTRHIKIRHYFVNQFLENGEMKIKYCPTDHMVADILTKPLQGEKFMSLARKLLGYDRH